MLQLSTLRHRGGFRLGYLVVMNDVTERKQEEERMLEHQRALATLRERDRLARELHDSLGQVLGFAKMQAQAARELLARGDAPQTDALLARLVSVAQDAHADVREFLLGARTDGAADLDFLPALEDYLHRFQATTGIATTLEASPSLVGRVLEPMAGTQLLRILQETLTNVRKHARARSVHVVPGRVRRPRRGDRPGRRRRFRHHAARDGRRGHLRPPLHARAGGRGGGHRPRRLRSGRWHARGDHRTARGEAVMRVLLADDHPLFLDGLKNLLAARGIDVVGVAHDGIEALEQVRALRPDVVLMDIHMPRLNGIAATRMIRAELSDTRIVLLTMSASDDELFEAISAGVSGYLLKTQDTGEVFRLLEEVARGEVALSPGLASRILNEFRRRAVAPPEVGETRPAESLSPRETQVLTLVAQGLTYKEAGAKLCLAERTIKYHMGEIVDRLHVAGRAQAIEYARRSGMVR